jgi:hypothetical protein
MIILVSILFMVQVYKDITAPQNTRILYSLDGNVVPNKAMKINYSIQPIEQNSSYPKNE